MDFFSERELVTQTGHARADWPLVIVKELVDNSLDACDEAEVAPVITVSCDGAGISVADNGPGLPEATLARAMDFSIRASNREAYVAPDRGAQGNALKTLLPMPSIVNPDDGRLVIEAHGKRHEIRCRADQVSQQPVIEDDCAPAATAGTTVRVEWGSADDRSWPFGGWSFDDSEEMDPCTANMKQLVGGFAAFNPHATIRLEWFGEVIEHKATATKFDKWRPCQPTSAHWYDPRHLERLIGAYSTHDRAAGGDRLVSDVVAEFDGLSGSAKRTKVLDACGLKRVHLSELVAGGQFDHQRIAALLDAMRANSRPVKPRRLGIIGEDHFRQRFEELGIISESFTYKRATAKAGMPYVIEVAFAARVTDDAMRVIYAGANWSAAINNPFRTFGPTGEGLESHLHRARAGRNEPIVLAIHLAHPRVEYTDRGKSAIVIEDESAAEEGDE